MVSLKAVCLGRNVRKRLGDQIILQLVTEYQRGNTTITLMERYGLSKTAVLKILRDNDVTMRRQPPTGRQVSEAARLRESGMSIARVAEQIRLPRESIRRALLNSGVNRREQNTRSQQGVEVFVTLPLFHYIDTTCGVNIFPQTLHVVY